MSEYIVEFVEARMSGKPLLHNLSCLGMKPIVRCRDCKYYDTAGPWCFEPSKVFIDEYGMDICPTVKPDGFCAWGEVRAGSSRGGRMTATDELRKMLDERGVEWKARPDGVTEWVNDGMTCKAVDRTTVGIEHLTMLIPVLTPDQAIAATLGHSLNNPSMSETLSERGTCEMHRDKYGVWHCSSCEKGADKITGSDGALDSWNDSWPPNFCPNCGAKVVNE